MCTVLQAFIIWNRERKATNMRWLLIKKNKKTDREESKNEDSLCSNFQILSGNYPRNLFQFSKAKNYM